MNRTLRLKVARQYLILLERRGAPKAALLEMRQRWGVSRTSVYAYVKELRGE